MTETPEMNEIEAAALAANRVRAAADAAELARRPNARNWPLVPLGIGLGIGSAALVAALLYANRPRDKDG